MSKGKAYKSPLKRNHGKAAGKRVVAQETGTVRMTRDGFVFVIIEGQDDDVYVPANKTRRALDGDTVRVAITRDRVSRSYDRAGQKTLSHRREGEIIDVLQRSGRQFVGIMHTVGAQAWVLMQSKNMPYDIKVDAEAAAAMGAKRGMKVSVVVDRWERGEVYPFGHLVDVLGAPGENETEMHAILAEFNLPYRFPSEVENAADSISEVITPEEIKGRKDFRDVLTFTIDPADAKDFDDALSFRKLSNGNYEVGVHIADVSHYVSPGSAVDKEARERGTSVYLVDRTVPMLPEKLCNKLCSLRPHEDKLTFSVVAEIDPKGNIKNRWIGRTIINSDYRFDYGQAQSIIEAGGTPPSGTLPADIVEAILILNGLAAIFKRKRFEAGAVNFDRPEMKVEVDAQGRPTDVHQVFSKEANWLIEEFMLLANRTVAEFVATAGQMNGVASKKAKTFVYRVHDYPNAEKLESLRSFARGFGYKIEGALDGAGAAKALNGLMESAKGKPEYMAFEDIALRCMAKACYSTDNIGHYGLAFPFYTHFTSPIRRYPDLMVHRLLSLYLKNGKSADQGYYEMECKHASEREVVAADAERTSVKYKLVEFMQDKVGTEFDGHVSGITEWGMYVEIEPTKIEGMVPLREIRSDFFEFDEERYRLVGRRTHRSIRLGDAVRIRVKGANLEQRLLDYELVENLR
ncbi:MAG: ribonuclease R [Bacteroidales bacterium]|nr:ribonuclease R [Bacteroidales bacterium]